MLEKHWKVGSPAVADVRDSGKRGACFLFQTQLTTQMKFSKMRIWCVPSATELESPKLPPRIDRDVYLRSPPPPPRLSREEKLARGVIQLKSRRKHAGRKVTSSKHRKVRKVSLSSSSGTSRQDGANSPRPLSPCTNLPQPHHQRQTSLAQTSSSSASRPPSRGGTVMSRQSVAFSSASFITRKNGKENSASPKSSPLSSSGFSGSLSTSVSSGNVSGTNNSNVIENVTKQTSRLTNKNSRYKSTEKLRYHNNVDIQKNINNNILGAGTNRPSSRSKSASRYNLNSETPKSTNNIVNTFRSTSTQNFTAKSFVAKLNQSNKSNMASEPSLIMHPGTSRSREKKNRNKRKKKGRT